MTGFEKSIWQLFLTITHINWRIRTCFSAALIKFEWTDISMGQSICQIATVPFEDDPPNQAGVGLWVLMRNLKWKWIDIRNSEWTWSLIRNRQITLPMDRNSERFRQSTEKVQSTDSGTDKVYPQCFSTLVDQGIAGNYSEWHKFVILCIRVREKMRNSVHCDELTREWSPATGPGLMRWMFWILLPMQFPDIYLSDWKHGTRMAINNLQ
jgi:hypothetical protein